MLEAKNLQNFISCMRAAKTTLACLMVVFSGLCIDTKNCCKTNIALTQKSFVDLCVKSSIT